MSALRTVIVAVLSAITGIALQFGLSGLAHRGQARAALDAPGADLTTAALGAPASAGPGGNFVTRSPSGSARQSCTSRTGSSSSSLTSFAAQ
jgi:hypothetical protein